MSTVLRKLRPYQQIHFQNFINILRDWYCGLDSSGTGRGKTYSTCALAAHLNLKIFLVSIGGVIEKWVRVSEEFGVEIVYCSTYDALRGTLTHSGVTLSHPYLVRSDDSDNSDFEATEEFKNLLQQGILCVFDECHKTKNDTSLCFRSCHAIVNATVRAESNSRVILLSATPVDRKESVFTILCMLGIIQSKSFYEISRGRKAEMTGFSELRDWCNDNVPEGIEGKGLTKQTRINKNSVTDVAIKLYQDIVKPKLVASMEVDMPYPPKIRNAYFPLPEDQLDKLNELLVRLCRLRMSVGTDNKKRQGAFGEINPIMQNIQKIKADTVIEFAKSILESVPHSKVVIYADYIEVHHYLHERLSSYGSILVNGSVTPMEKRDRMFASFQEPNDNVRVGVFHPAVGGVGLDLDDKDGNFPRYFLIMPGFNFINIHQSVGRGSRESTKSTAHVYFIYASGVREIRILNSLRSKGKVTSEIVSKAHEIYPSEYGEITYSSPHILDSKDFSESDSLSSSPEKSSLLSYDSN